MSVRMNVTLNGELSGLDGLTERLTAAAAEGMRAGLLPMERTAKQLCPVDTGDLRNSIRAEVRVKGGGVEGKLSANSDHAVYVEMGTGDVGRASGGNGSGVQVSYRHGGWFVPLPRGAVMVKDTILKDASAGFWTYGQPARPYLYPAYRQHREGLTKTIRAAMLKSLKGGG